MRSVNSGPVVILLYEISSASCQKQIKCVKRALSRSLNMTSAKHSLLTLGVRLDCEIDGMKRYVRQTDKYLTFGAAR